MKVLPSGASYGACRSTWRWWKVKGTFLTTDCGPYSTDSCDFGEGDFDMPGVMTC